MAGAYDDELLERLGAALFHRGPDGGGSFSANGAAIVARRLAILDLPGGEQPLRSDDGRSTIVFNGEIYNVRELKRELEADGVLFRSDHSDTELVLRLYERYGLDFLPRLNGMFAFVILDSKKRSLVAARDRFGIKPLYWTESGSRVTLASELRTLLQTGDVERTVDRESLWHYLTLRFVPGERSIFEGVQRLPAGHSLTVDLDTNATDVRRWYRLRFNEQTGLTRDDWREKLRETLQSAVLRWNLADVPVACSLSGGIDSSAIVGLLGSSGVDLRTYSLGFTDTEDERLNELPLARALAGRYGTDHHELVVDADELLDDLLQMVWALDEPYGGGLPSWYVFRAIATDVKVAHTGSGGDELFGNYRRFVPFESGRLSRLRPRDVGRYHVTPAYYFSEHEKRQLLVERGPSTPRYLQDVFDESGSRNARDSVLYLDVSTQLTDEFLLMTDRFSMAHSLEARTPFLDHELVELVASIHRSCALRRMTRRASCAMQSPTCSRRSTSRPPNAVSSSRSRVGCAPSYDLWPSTCSPTSISSAKASSVQGSPAAISGLISTVAPTTASACGHCSCSSSGITCTSRRRWRKRRRSRGRTSPNSAQPVVAPFSSTPFPP